MSEPKHLIVLNFNSLSPAQSRRMHQLARNHGGVRLSTQKIIGKGYQTPGFDLTSQSIFLAPKHEKARVFVFPDNDYSSWYFTQGLRSLGYDRQISYCSNVKSAKPSPFHRHSAMM